MVFSVVAIGLRLFRNFLRRTELDAAVHTPPIEEQLAARMEEVAAVRTEKKTENYQRNQAEGHQRWLDPHDAAHVDPQDPTQGNRPQKGAHGQTIGPAPPPQG